MIPTVFNVGFRRASISSASFPSAMGMLHELPRRTGGERFVVEAEEILLTAGAIASPQLLMLSVVGPADHLHSLGIPVVHALPGIGQNLRDHPNIRVPVQVKEGFPLDPKAPRTQLALRYTAEGSSARNDIHGLLTRF